MPARGELFYSLVDREGGGFVKLADRYAEES